MRQFPLRYAIPALLIFYAILSGTYTLWHNGRIAAIRIEQESLQNLTLQMTSTQGTLDYLLLKGDTERIQAEIASLGADPEVNSLLVIDDRDRILAANQRLLLDASATAGLPHLSTEDTVILNNALARARNLMSGYTFPVKKGQAVMATYPLVLEPGMPPDRERRVGVLTLLKDITAVKSRAQRDVEKQALESSLFLIALAFILWGLSYIAVTRRMNQLLSAAASLASGNLGARTNLHGGDELGQIGAAFDSMASQVELNQSTLEEREQRFRRVIESAPNAMVMTDSAGTIVLLNDRMEKLFGYTRSELTGQPIDMLVPMKYWDCHQGHRERYMRNPRQRLIRDGCDLYGLHKDGAEIPLEIGLSPLTISDQIFVLAAITDVTQRKLAEERLFEEKERAQVTLHSIGDAVITTDSFGYIDYLNPVAESLTGWTLNEVHGHPLSEIFTLIKESTGQPPALDILETCLQEGRNVSLTDDTALINRDGKEIAIEHSAAPIRDRQQNVIGIVIIFHDVSGAREMANRLSWQASHDFLTGLHNRNEFEKRLQHALSAAHDSGKVHSLLYMDLDQFKVVNDTCGHNAGDELLRQLSALLGTKMRDNDTLARLGGDEFGILLEGCPLAQGKRIAEEVCQIIRDFRFAWEGKNFELGASIGVVEINHQNFDMSSVLSRADMSCYLAKESGRNRVHTYSEGDLEIARRHTEMEWVTRLTRAIEEERLVLYTQNINPLRETDQTESQHLEILLRLRDEYGKIILPGAFIGAAERYNFMPMIDRWVIKTMFSLINEGKLFQSKLAGLTSIYAINLSGASLNDPQFITFLQHQFDTLKANPSCICFEITETAAIASLSRAIQLMQELKARGCQFALDDFGSGVSSFGYLKNLPVDYLKIDGNLVRDIATDPVDHTMVSAINQIGHVMGIKTIAEFVENESILNELKSIGVDFGQGYGIHKPAPLLQL